MKIVGRVNIEIVKWCVGVFQFFEVLVEVFVFYKKGGIWKKGVDDFYGIMFVKCCNEVVVGILYSLYVLGSNVIGCFDQCKVVFYGCVVGLGKGMDLVFVFQVDGFCCWVDGVQVFFKGKFFVVGVYLFSLFGRYFGNQCIGRNIVGYYCISSYESISVDGVAVK